MAEPEQEQLAPQKEGGQVRAPVVRMLLAYGALLALSVLWWWWSDSTDLVPFGRDMLQAALNCFIGIGCGLVAAMLSQWSGKRFEWARKLELEFIRLIGPLTRFDITALVVASALAEEILFRGILQQEFGLLFASLVFGLLHFGPDRTYLPWTVMALAMGFILGGMMILTGDLIAPIACHGTINLINLSSIARKARTRAKDESRNAPQEF